MNQRPFTVHTTLRGYFDMDLDGECYFNCKIRRKPLPCVGTAVNWIRSLWDVEMQCDDERGWRRSSSRMRVDLSKTRM
jgi:hypothetical protein